MIVVVFAGCNSKKADTSAAKTLQPGNNGQTSNKKIDPAAINQNIIDLRQNSQNNQ